MDKTPCCRKIKVLHQGGFLETNFVIEIPRISNLQETY